MTKLRFLCLLLCLLIPASLNAQDLNEEILTASRKGDVEKVKALLDKGADVNAKTRYNQTPLFFACSKGNIEIVKLLLERGATVNIQDTFYGMTPLDQALSKESVPILKMLLEKGASGKEASLNYAVGKGLVEIVKIILEQGGIKQETLDKQLSAAMRNNKTEVADLLKKAGAKEIPEFKVSEEALKMYEGTFKNDNTAIVFKIKDGKLIGTSNGFDNIMIPVSQHVFEIEQANGVSVTFMFEGEKITGLTLKHTGGQMVLKKEASK